MFYRPQLYIVVQHKSIIGYLINKKSKVLEEFIIENIHDLEAPYKEHVKQALIILSKYKYDPYHIKVIVDGNLAIFRSFFTYFKNEKRTPKGVAYEIKTKVSFPIDSMRWDYQYKKVNHNYFVQFGAVNEEYVTSVLTTLERLGIKPSSLTIEPILLDQYLQDHKEKSDAYIFLIDHSYHILCYQNEALVYYIKFTEEDCRHYNQFITNVKYALRETGKDIPSITVIKQRGSTFEYNPTTLPEINEFPMQMEEINEHPYICFEKLRIGVLI